jgi:hypothetical protein
MELSATMGVDAGGSDEMVARAGAGNVVVTLGDVDVVGASVVVVVVVVGGGASLDEVMKGLCRPSLLVMFPTAVHKPLGAHETPRSLPFPRALWPSINAVAGRAVPHVPFEDVTLNPSSSPAVFLKNPTAAQLPADAQARPYGMAKGLLAWTPFGNVMVDADPHTPSVELMAKGTAPPAGGVKSPTAMQFPAEEHTTSLISEKPAPGMLTGCAVAHVPSVDITVNAK